MSFYLDTRSMGELEDTHPDLRAVVYIALQTPELLARVHDGTRSASEQKALFEKGATQLDGYHKISKHQIQDTGFSHAVDIVPFINGRFRWEWGPIYQIASAMALAADNHGVRLRWGGDWKEMTPGTALEMEQRVNKYGEERRALGKRAFTDGPHFELIT